MIVKLRKPRKDGLLWQIRDREYRLSRAVSARELPERVLIQADDIDTYWHASVNEEGRIMLHGRVPQQRW